MKNVCLVGMWPHAKRIHLNYFKKKKINLALLVELESNKKASRNYLDKNGFKDTKIFAVNSFNSAILSVVFGLIGSGLLTVMSIEYSMIAFGIISISIISIVLVYMKKRVGLDPKQYSELELKYDKMK